MFQHIHMPIGLEGDTYFLLQRAMPTPTRNCTASKYLFSLFQKALIVRRALNASGS